FEEVETHRKNRTLPPRQYEPGDWHCSYCSFEEMCNAESKKEFSMLGEKGVTNLKGIEPLVRSYVEFSRLKKEAEENLEELKKGIKEVLKLSGVRKANVDGYTISLSLQKRHILDKNLIPFEILKEIQKESLVEVLTVKEGIKN
ncbi:MAG: hypothetical protein NC920_03730, partial [Candidatus Omnitrophica bacterium]|nr:hypothetical protein [Candidatus Omnitrophota bacterium]